MLGTGNTLRFNSLKNILTPINIVEIEHLYYHGILSHRATPDILLLKRVREGEGWGEGIVLFVQVGRTWVVWLIWEFFKSKNS